MMILLNFKSEAAFLEGINHTVLFGRLLRRELNISGMEEQVRRGDTDTAHFGVRHLINRVNEKETLYTINNNNNNTSDNVNAGLIDR